MFIRFGRLGLLFAALLSMPVLATPALAQLDISILSTLKYDQLQWLEDPANPGSWYTVLSGNPSASGPYVILNKMLKNSFTQPHSHPLDRQIYVVNGTWWVGTGTVLDPAAAVATQKGSTVTHLANQVHWDGAKDEEVLLLIGGEGPAVEVR
jgi:ChrR-like protein with cupin domain